MREIKFRAWHKLEEVMVPDDSLIFKMWLRQTEEEIKLFEMHIDYRTKFWDSLSDRYQLMQFTGLRDKNGREIYEGDILEDTHDGGSVTQVEWNCGGWEIHCRYDPTDKYGRKNGIRFGWWTIEAMQYLEVIGNIYEDPDLLISSTE